MRFSSSPQLRVDSSNLEDADLKDNEFEVAEEERVAGGREGDGELEFRFERGKRRFALLDGKGEAKEDDEGEGEVSGDFLFKRGDVKGDEGDGKEMGRFLLTGDAVHEIGEDKV